MTFDIHQHGRRYPPEYPPRGFSDHLPMTWLALEGLGAPPARREAFAADYLPRLSPLPSDDPRRRRQQTLIDEITADGMAAVVERRLPALVSGWYREAYHPLIRLGYAVRFGVAEEAAAALAYMEACGPDATMTRLAGQCRRVSGSGLDLFGRARHLRADIDHNRSFTSRAQAVLARPAAAEMALVVDDDLRQMSSAALAAFDSTHDFFALHLVTASHAFRLLSPWAGPDADAILNLGLLVGYLAIGAPAISDAPAGAAPAAVPTRARLLALCRDDDEHDAKIAFAAWEQARHWQDPRYLVAVERYLKREPA